MGSCVRLYGLDILSNSLRKRRSPAERLNSIARSCSGGGAAPLRLIATVLDN
jgi:hypothetical protein